MSRLTRTACHALATTSVLALVALSACVPEDDPREITGPDGDVGELVDGGNDFALDLYDQLSAEEGNLFISPFSISAALSMTYAGAAGDTAKEMAEVLNVTLDDDGHHAAFGDLIADLGGEHPGRGYELLIANRLFGQAEFGFLEDFLQITADDYGAELEEMDFISDPEGCRAAINAWVAEQTRDCIEELLPGGSISDMTRLVLTNAIYFNADWITAFDPEETTDDGFTLADGEVVTTPIMHATMDAEYGWVDGVSVLRLPYEDDEVSMVVLLPDEHDGLPDLEASLDRATLDDLIDAVEESPELEVALPTFEFSHKLLLSDTLKALGMEQAFDVGQADFTGMTAEPGLFISEVYHEAFVHVDEAGTEAAAATAVVMDFGSAPSGFTADHPFLFLIRDDLTGSVLFMGRVADPR